MLKYAEYYNDCIIDLFSLFLIYRILFYYGVTVDI